MEQFDAVVLAGGAEVPRDLPVPGRDLAGVHFALEFLIPQNKVNGGRWRQPDPCRRQARHRDRRRRHGLDCVGTSNRHGATSVTQFELLPQPPEEENKPLVWPYWPIKLRTSSSHDEGCSRDWSVATKELVGENGKVTALKACRVEWKDGKMQEVPGSEFVLQADLVLLAMGFTNPVARCSKRSASTRMRARTPRHRPKAIALHTNVPKVFAAGDVRRGQSLVVWAIREGRQAARAVDAFLMGHSNCRADRVGFKAKQTPQVRTCGGFV
jgi:glutamate synthase (NADPH/NADH) small chain